MTTDELLHDALTRAADSVALPAVDLDAVRAVRRRRERARRTGAVVAVLAVLAGAAALVLPASRTPLGRITTLADAPTATALSVTCTGTGITVTPGYVRTTPAGVVLDVDNRAAAGTYLNLSWSGGAGQGDPMTAGTSTRTVTVPPGPLTLTCADASRARATVQVVDVDGNWSSISLADLGCSMSGLADWAVGSRTGATPEQALDHLGSALAAASPSRGPITWARADVGYRDAATTTWVGSDDGGARLTALVSRQGDLWSAGPDAVCR
jgi:hypothetical protein